jgi:hypothetical protein
MFGMNGHTGRSPSTKSCFRPVRSGFLANPVGVLTESASDVTLGSDSLVTSGDVNHNSSVCHVGGVDLPAVFVHLFQVDDVDGR